MSKLDLGYGNPVFLQELNNNVYTVEHTPNDMPYPDTKPVFPLKLAIEHLHNRVGNVARVGDYNIVIGNGASQILYALGQIMDVSYSAPYWNRFPQFFSKPDKSVTPNKLLTFPNNPDGKIVLPASYPLVDASYHWPTYYRLGETVPQLTNHEVIVFSLSKLTGHASLRLGWALVKDPKLAEELAMKIEYMSCGVSMPAQLLGAKILNGVTPQFLDSARNKLDARREAVEQFYPSHLYGRQRGMFFYTKDEHQNFEQLGIEGIRGSAFGDSNDMIRLNLGCSTEVFNQLIARMSIRSTQVFGL